MSVALKTFLSMSFSGSLLILILLVGKRFLKDKISRQWQYYIWLIIVLRLLLPFGPEINLMGKAYQAIDQAITQATPLPQQQFSLNVSGGAITPAVGLEQNSENTISPIENLATAHPTQDIGVLRIDHVLLIWLAVALGLLIRKVTIYQGFMQYIHAGLTPVSDIEILDRLSVVAKRTGIQKPIELCVNPLISSPLLIGFFHPCIVLPSADISEKDFQYIALHELTHYRRRDMFYKWLVQFTVCLHWFNPLVHLMSREIAKACEFSCDEAVLAKMGGDNAQDYGKTLLDAMAAVGRYKENLGAVTLSENKQLLKERIGAIMNFKKKSTLIRILTGVLTLCIIFGAAFSGIYSVAAASDQTLGKASSALDLTEITRTPTQGEKEIRSEAYSSKTERYYETGSLPLFEIAFFQLDESEQKTWLEKLYADDDFAFFSVAVRGLGTNSSLFADFAVKAYDDEKIAFFSILADCMDESELGRWLDRAQEDGKWNFQSMLFDKLGKSDEWDAAQMEEYQAAGVTMNGKNYYYRGQLVNIFLDIRANKSFYTLNMNPNGTVNIKIIRNADNEIAYVAYMTEAEVEELLGDMDDDWPGDTDDIDDWLETAGGRVWYPQVLPVNLETMADGEVIWLGEYTLSEGDRIWYDVSAETGNGLQVGFAEPEDELLNTTYYSVQSLRQNDETLRCAASITLRPLVKPGTYKLFLRATDGALENVKGSISIGFVADATYNYVR